MAGTGLGLFLPSETAYKDPGRFRDVLAAEGNKEAQYLASMDQFFAQLEESQRQFNITSEQRERFFEEELAWAKEKSDAELVYAQWAKEQDIALGARGQDVTRFGYQTQRDVGMAGVAATRERTGMEYELGTRKLDITEDVGEFYRGLYRTEEARRQETHEVAREGIFGMRTPTPEPTYDRGGYEDIYTSRDEGGALTFSNVPTRDREEPDWSIPW